MLQDPLGVLISARSHRAVASGEVSYTTSCVELSLVSAALDHLFLFSTGTCLIPAFCSQHFFKINLYFAYIFTCLYTSWLVAE